MIRPVEAPPPITGTLTGPAVAMYDVKLEDPTQPLKSQSDKSEIGIEQDTYTVVEEQPRDTLLDFFLCWYCPGAFILTRLCCRPPSRTVVRRVQRRALSHP